MNVLAATPSIRLAILAALLCTNPVSALAGLLEGLQATKYKNYEVGFHEIIVAAESGSVLAQRYAGYYYEFGWGTSKNYLQAVQWYSKAAETGDVKAKARLAPYFFMGDRGVAKDCKKALLLSHQAAALGDVDAYQVLSRISRMGVCVPKSMSDAINWSTKAAEQNDSGSQHFIGVQYWQGNGVKRDFDEAHKWFMRAALQGNGAAMVALAGMYFGDGRPYDPVTGVTWLRLAQISELPNEERLRLEKMLKARWLVLTDEQRQEVEHRVTEFKSRSLWNEKTEQEWQEMFSEAKIWDASHSLKATDQ